MTMRLAKRAATSFLTLAATAVKRSLSRWSGPCADTTTKYPASMPATQSLPSLAPATGLAITATAGELACMHSRSTACSTGEWKPLTTAWWVRTWATAQSMAARMAVPLLVREAKNAVSGASSKPSTPTPDSRPARLRRCQGSAFWGMTQLLSH